MSSGHTSSRRSNSSDSSSTVAGPVSVAGTTNGYGFRSAGGDALSIEMQFLNPRRRFPLADEYLPAVHVTEEQVEDLRETCDQLAADALGLTSMFAWEDSNNNNLMGEHRDQWTVHFKRPHVMMYRKKRGKDATADELEDATDDSNGGLRHYVVSGQIHDMTLGDVEYGLYCDATLDERAVKTDLYRELFLDAAVLRIFETQTPEDPFHFFGIKWLAHLSPADKFISPRDFAFVEYSRRVVGPKGEPLLVKVQQSLGPEHVDAMNRREFDLVRAQMSCTTVYRHDKRANNRMDDFLLGGTIAASTTVPTVDDDEEVDDDDESVVEFAMLGDGPGVAMHAAISEAQRLQRLKQRYLENEKRKYLSGPRQQTPVQHFVMEQQQQMHHYEQSTHSINRPQISRRSSQPTLNGSMGSSSMSSAYNSASSAYSSLSMSSSTYSSAEAAAAATAALQANTGFHEMEHSISEQEALLRSLQNEYAKMSMNRTAQRLNSNPSFNAQQMRETRLAEWQTSERSHALALPPTFNQYDIDD
ncbi:unnamed protein product [Phytophthora lilii]|uniref:Unnamed protein product n=1 Tax=Phytophthora lilii TaxID=2077276 RepID=A0A9W6WXQ0_9STRA|nr:unnamed protein product [Phytophthora lilii]